jgi:5-methyltetrahydrofolate--homocysteine methyltransferase
MHTAVKIAPEYDNGVIHVLDASRSVTMTGSLLSDEQKPAVLQTILNEYAALRESFGKKQNAKNFLKYELAKANPVQIDWEGYTPPVPSFTGHQAIDGVTVADLRSYIDWKPFFIAWEMHGNFPDILQDEIVGKEATKLYADANALLDRIEKEKWLTPKGVVGFWPAYSQGDEVTLSTEDNEYKLQFLRQQSQKVKGQPNFSLADFIAPPNPSAGGGLVPDIEKMFSSLKDVTVSKDAANSTKAGGELQGADFLGAFAVTIHGIEPHIKAFEEELDDYNKIMLQALADRLVEAFAEYLHLRTRKEFWGYQQNEGLTNEELIKEKYVGIRPAPGYPACPDHTEKYKLFDMLDASNKTGITLTESLAMYPSSSVCGWYFSHPQSQYFGVGKIQRDQLEDYAKRKGEPIEFAEQWLRPNLEG